MPTWDYYFQGDVKLLKSNVLWQWWKNSSQKCFGCSLPKPQIATTLSKFHWRFWIYFLEAIVKAKKLISKSIAHNLKQASMTKRFLALAMAFNLLLSNLTAVAKAKTPLCQWNWRGYFFQLVTKRRELEPRPKVAN